MAVLLRNRSTSSLAITSSFSFTPSKTAVYYISFAFTSAADIDTGDHRWMNFNQNPLDDISLTASTLPVALATAAVSFIVAHNHPSGNLKPSVADKEITHRLKTAARIMDIEMKDHLIISPHGKYLSFADEGLM